MAENGGTRREFLATAGVGLAAGAAAAPIPEALLPSPRGTATPVEVQGTQSPEAAAVGARPWTDVPPTKGVIMVDTTICGCCRTCEAVCSLYHDKVVNPELARIVVLRDWTKPNSLEVDFEPVTCMQCENPPCLQDCPMQAIKVDEVTGARVVDQSLCIPCHVCEKSCPFTPARVRFDMKGKAIKCDLCGGSPQCVEFCPSGALKYVHNENGLSGTGYPSMGGD